MKVNLNYFFLVLNERKSDEDDDKNVKIALHFYVAIVAE